MQYSVCCTKCVITSRKSSVSTHYLKTFILHIGIGLASFLGGIGLTLIPFVNYLGTQWLVLPIVMMGAFSVAGGIVTLKLPETLGAKLPQTLEEGEDFGKDFQGWADAIQQISR